MLLFFLKKIYLSCCDSVFFFFFFCFKVSLLYSMMFITNVLFNFSGFASGLLKVLEFNLLFPYSHYL